MDTGIGGWQAKSLLMAKRERIKGRWLHGAKNHELPASREQEAPYCEQLVGQS
jgi:hypothetical protein